MNQSENQFSSTGSEPNTSRCAKNQIPISTTTLKRRVLHGLSLLGILANHALAGSGAWDQSYAPTVGGPVYATGLQQDGRLLIGGAFTSVNNSSSRNHLARLFADGSLDTTFLNSASGVSSTIWGLAVRPDGRFVIGGDFTSVNQTSRTRVSRLY